MIKLISKYKYDNNYDYIKLFSSKTEQNNYFNDLTSIIVDDDDGYIREGDEIFIEYNKDFLSSKDINYMIWDNGYKELFCFITKKEYVDEQLTKLYYEIDVLNTYLFDFTLGNSFVERMNCELDKVSDYDEGLNIGDYTLRQVCLEQEKEYTYYAMMNGIKNQEIIFDKDGKVTDVIELPQPTLKPSTLIQDIAYPIHFIPLKEEYKDITFSLNTPDIGGSGGNVGGNQDNITVAKISREGTRFIKGFEAYAPYNYQDMYGYWTIGYGVTLHGEPTVYNDLLNKMPVSEEYCAKIAYNLKNENYTSKIFDFIKECGCTKQYQLDAFTSLAYNCGWGIITKDYQLIKALKEDPTNKSKIQPLWEDFFVNGSNGLRLRRIEECKMFFNEPFEVREIPKIGQDGSIIGKVTENNGNGWLP